MLAVQATARTRADAIALAQAYGQAALEQRRRSLAASAQALLAQVKSAPDPPPDKVAALLPLAQGFDPSFSQVANAPPSAGSGRALRLAGARVGTGGGLRARGRRRAAERRRDAPPPGGAGARGGRAEPEPDQGTVHELSRRAEWPPS